MTKTKTNLLRGDVNAVAAIDIIELRFHDAFQDAVYRVVVLVEQLEVFMVVVQLGGIGLRGVGSADITQQPCAALAVKGSVRSHVRVVLRVLHVRRHRFQLVLR